MIEWEFGGRHGWRSTAYGSRVESPTGVLSLTSRLPVTLATALDLEPEPDADPELRLEVDDGVVRLRWSGRHEWERTLPSGPTPTALA